MATSLIKLSEKIKLKLPTALPNGDNPTWAVDPYLEDNTKWNGGLADVVSIKNIGTTRQAGLAGAWLLYTNAGSISSIASAYIEIINSNCPLPLVSGGNYLGVSVPAGPGYYLATGLELLSGSNGIGWAEGYFCPDSRFKMLPYGTLLNNANTNSPYWYTTSNYASKRSDGRISLNVSAVAPGGVLLASGINWAQQVKVDHTITVDFIQPGTVIRLVDAGGAAALDIDAPGTYTVTTELGAGEKPSILFVSGSTPKPVIISQWDMIKQGQAWRTEGNLFAQVGCIFIAPTATFDAIVNPYNVISSNQLQRKNLASQAPPSDPRIGFSSKLPPSGPRNLGDTIYNPAMVSGQPSGWRCTAGGNPGTWAALPLVP